MAALLDIFSKRNKKGQAGQADVYVYDVIPPKLRVQIVHAIQDGFGAKPAYEYDSIKLLEDIHDMLCREYGVFNLRDKYEDKHDAMLNFLLQTEDTEKCLDTIEICIKAIDVVIRGNEYKYRPNAEVDDIIKEINYRFKENCVGYQYEGKEIIRVDSDLLHSEVVKPVLQLLGGKRFKGANNEFLKAHEHYRHKRFKESLNECLKAFESVMKTICETKKWKFEQNATAKKLIETLLTNKLLPSFFDSQLNTLRSLLESGVPTVRNKLGGHGQGTEEVRVPDYYASYMLHLTATTILFLLEAQTETNP